MRFVEFFAATTPTTPTPGGPTTGLWLAFAPGVRNRGLEDLQRILPLHVAAYIEQLQHELASPSRRARRDVSVDGEISGSI